MWVVGHFHLTLGMSVVMTFFGISYWLVPYISKRVLTPQMNKLGVIQTIIWTVGMVFMSGAMHRLDYLVHLVELLIQHMETMQQH